MNLALLTCADLPQGDADDSHLVAALRRHRVDVNWLIWNQIKQPPKQELALIRSVWDYHKRPQRFIRAVEQLNQHMTVLNPPDVVRWNSNKIYLQELQKAGLPVTETRWIHQKPRLDYFLQMIKRGKTDVWFLKPQVGADAYGTLRFRTDSEGVAAAMAHLNQYLSHSAMMLQPFLPSVSDAGELSVIYVDEQLSHAVIKKPQADDYRVQDTFGGVDSLYQLNAAEQALAERCMAYLWHRFGSLCYARLDFLRGLTGQWMLNEVELIEPSLFFRHHTKAADKLVNAVLRRT